jgi:hypothetical protein
LLAPARLFTEIDAKRRFGYDLVDKERICRMEATAARIAEQRSLGIGARRTRYLSKLVDGHYRKHLARYGRASTRRDIAHNGKL